jgi:hypothetical protein
MKTLLNTLMLVLAVALVGGPALAAEKEGVHFPDTDSVNGKTLVLNGLGVREATVLNVNVYVAGLYLLKRTSDANAILNADEEKKLVLQFVRDVDREDVVKAWSEGFKANAGGDYAALEARITKLLGWMSGVKEGDSFYFSYTPGKGLKVSIKGENKGTIEGFDFAKVFYKIWLGPKPPNEGLKKGLLGLE